MADQYQYLKDLSWLVSWETVADLIHPRLDPILNDRKSDEDGGSAAEPILAQERAYLAGLALDITALEEALDAARIDS